MTLTIGVDVGGTKVAGGVVDQNGAVLASNRRPTPAEDPAATRDTIVEVAAELARQFPEATAIGIGAAAWIDAAGSTVLFAPNLAWRDEPLRDYVSKAVGLPTVLENDANVAAWAEFRFGVARNADDSMVMITVGTGIGGGIVLNGRLWHGANGIAGELGHIQSVPDGHPCGCGRLGCLEQYASGNALVRFARAGARQEPERARQLLELAGGDPLAITGRQITEAARAGDGVAKDAFGQIGYWLGVAMADLAQALDPQILVVGGGVVDAGDLLMEPTRTTYRDQLKNRGRFPVADVVAAETGNTAGVVGAADLARRIWGSVPVSGVPLRVMSYNVHGLKDDRAALIGLIREAAPDVLVVQEAPRRFRWRQKCATLADEAGMVVAAGGLPSLGNLLLVSLRVRVHETWCMRYPLTPGRHLRGAAFARGSVRGATFTVSGSHLATDPAERPNQAALWKEAISAVEGPVIAAADLNEGPGGGAWRTVEDGLVTTANGRPTFPATVPARLIDGLFVTPDIAIERYEALESDQARRASDHLPLIVDLLLPSS